MNNVTEQAAVMDPADENKALAVSTAGVTGLENEHEEKSFKSLQLVVFRLKGEEYALRIEQIKEVVLTPKITAVPQTARHVVGVANIRGNILAIVNLESRFGLDREDEPGQPHGRFTLVLDDREFKVGILVQEVPNTIEVSEDALDESPDIIQDSVVDDRAIEAIAKVGERLIILLDIRRALGNEILNEVVGRAETQKVSNN